MPKRASVKAERRYNAYCVYRRHGRYNQSRGQAQVRGGFGSLGVFVATAGVLLGLVYLFTVNASAMHGARVYELEQSIKVLKKEQEQLLISAAELRALSRVEEHVRGDGMQDVTDAQYVVER